jgi:tetratricopeptide (TPR) repeat protein
MTAISPKKIEANTQKILPLFGEVEKSDTQRKAEAAFVERCRNTFGDAENASIFFAQRAWEYLVEGQQDTAVYRFNLAFLLNDHNVEAYWGLGVISYQRGLFDESARLLRKGLAIQPSNPLLMVDLATVQINCFKEKRSCEDLDESLSLLQKAIELDSTNANAHLKLAVAHYQNGHYSLAWESFHKCRTLDPEMIDEAFVKDLNDKLQDPYR